MQHDIGVFNHCLYEYKKGLRILALYTGSLQDKDTIERKLKRGNIDYYIQKVNESKVNVFFGDTMCLDIIKRMNFKSLSNLTDEEDFILGIMLGYERLRQCERYLKRKQRGYRGKDEKRAFYHQVAGAWRRDLRSTSQINP